MAALPFETPEFTALLDDADVWLETWQAQYRAAFTACFGQSPDAMFAAMAYAQLVAGESLVAGYRARNASKARHNVISTGAVRAPRCETAASRVIAEARAWGLAS